MDYKIKKMGGILVLAIFLGILAVCVSSSAKTSEWKQIKGSENAWERDEPKDSPYTVTHLYIAGNELCTAYYYKETESKHITPGHDKITSWKMDKSDHKLTIITVKGNSAYVQLSDDYGKSSLYSVNIKTKKKKLVSKKFNATLTLANYIYANTVNPSDTGAYPVNAWKIGNSSIKKVRILGKYIFGIKKVGKYIYYGKYKSSSQKKVTVYRANLDGSHQKKLFTVKGKGKYVQTLLCGVSKKQIKVSTSIDGKSVLYTYNIKTKKLKKK